MGFDLSTSWMLISVEVRFLRRGLGLDGSSVFPGRPLLVSACSVQKYCSLISELPSPFSLSASAASVRLGCLRPPFISIAPVLLQLWYQPQEVLLISGPHAGRVPWPSPAPADFPAGLGGWSGLE